MFACMDVYNSIIQCPINRSLQRRDFVTSRACTDKSISAEEAHASDRPMKGHVNRCYFRLPFSFSYSLGLRVRTGRDCSCTFCCQLLLTPSSFHKLLWLGLPGFLNRCSLQGFETDCGCSSDFANKCTDRIERLSFFKLLIHRGLLPFRRGLNSGYWFGYGFGLWWVASSVVFVKLN